MNKKKAVERLNPKVVLTLNQNKIALKVLDFCTDSLKNGDGKTAVFVLEGDPGTGKSLLLNYIFTTIQSYSHSLKKGAFYKTDNVFLVNHPEMLRLYKNISNDFPYLLKKNYQRPTSFINKAYKENKKNDITIIDEAHLLLTRRDVYNHFNQQNQLEEILKISKIVVLAFDGSQTLKSKSFWTKEKLSKILKENNVGDIYWETLSRQFRMETMGDDFNWIKNFCEGRVLSLNRSQSSYDLRFFDDAEELYKLILKRNNETGMARMLSTYDYPYNLKKAGLPKDKGGRDYYIEEGRFKLRWDRPNTISTIPWAEREDTINEVGSVYTIQGFDLSFAGVIIGPSICYNAKTKSLMIIPKEYEDSAAFSNLGKADDHMKEDLIMNALYVLMTRGRKGLYIYAHDKALREVLKGL